MDRRRSRAEGIAAVKIPYRLGGRLALASLLVAGCASRTASPADTMMVRLDIVERALGSTEIELRERTPQPGSTTPTSWSDARRALQEADAALQEARKTVSIWRSGDARPARPRLDELSRRLDEVRAALLPTGVSPSPGLLETLERPSIERANVDAGPAPPNQG